MTLVQFNGSHKMYKIFVWYYLINVTLLNPPNALKLKLVTIIILIIIIIII